MFFNRMFRERALQRRGRQEPLDDLLQVTAPHEWLIVSGLGLMVVALIVYSIFARVERTAFYDAVVVLTGERHDLVAPVNGRVVDVMVEETDTLAEGQPVAYVQANGGRYRQSVVQEFINALEESRQLEEGRRTELLQGLFAAALSMESAPVAPIISPGGGVVVSLDLELGQAVAAGSLVGQIRTEAAGQPEVLAYVSPDDAASLSTGMTAQVNVERQGAGAIEAFQGRVTHVSPVETNPPLWLSGQGMAIPRQPHELRVALTDGRPGLPMTDGAKASLRVVLGHESLASLVVLGRGDQ